MTHAGSAGVTSEELAEWLGLRPRSTTLMLSKLEDIRVISIQGQRASTTNDCPSPEQIWADISERDAQRKRMRLSRLEMMRAYAETSSCRRRALLSYFGEEHHGSCGRCDNCCSGGSAASNSPARSAERWGSGARVRHPEFGDGQVMREDADTVVVLFDEHGYRTLDAELVETAHLLTIVEQA